jgi:hypothetical protein
MSFARSFYALVSFYADLHNKETSFVYQGKRGFFVAVIGDKWYTAWNSLPIWLSKPEAMSLDC